MYPAQTAIPEARLGAHQQQSIAPTRLATAAAKCRLGDLYALAAYKFEGDPQAASSFYAPALLEQKFDSHQSFNVNA